MDLDLCTKHVAAIDACLAAVQEVKVLTERLRSLHYSSLEHRLGLALHDQTKGFSHAACLELAQQWGSDEAGFITLDQLSKQTILLKNRGYLRVDGNSAAVVEEVTEMCNRLAKAAADSGTLHRSGAGHKLDLPATLESFGKANEEHATKERDAEAAVRAAEERAKALQVAYMGEEARADKEAELARAAAKWRHS